MWQIVLVDGWNFLKESARVAPIMLALKSIVAAAGLGSKALVLLLVVTPYRNAIGVEVACHRSAKWKTQTNYNIVT